MLDIQNLSIRFTRYTFGLKKKEVCVVRDFDLSIAPGQVMAVIGQSGAGKSLLAHALLGILPRNAKVEGRILFKGKPLTPERLSALRGREIALIPQSITALNPLLRVGVQVARAARLSGISKKDVPTTVRRAFSRYLLRKEVAHCFPFQLSGGMARRVLTATATVGMADLILADEPTSGLDPITAREALTHLRELADTGKAVLLITHDIAAALQVADMVTVFCAGTTVEVARADDFKGLDQLRHPYTRALWDALPANSFIGTMKPIERTSDAAGCPFQPCCNDQNTVCGQSTPELKDSGEGRVRCHHA
ncbi:MAG: ABC transporter ATP-binding protein [Proteobacteria bacterium]|nr:ABC transporter ATP-binding protein [Pseudomonadota bacterium]MBU1648481.1 ABC transporter ATP-binding protein [Pseudomonadota bacterium]MBU1986281.1 ABC transporter ATP-binding protein [Pseudomonadota bacterium]